MVVTYQARQDTAERDTVTQSEASTKEPRSHPKPLTVTDSHALIRAVTTITATLRRRGMQVRHGTSPHLFEVASETEPDKWYQVYANGQVIKCTCKGYLSHKACHHVDAVRQHVQQTAGGVEPAEGRETAPAVPGALTRWNKQIHGR